MKRLAIWRLAAILALVSSQAQVLAAPLPSEPAPPPSGSAPAQPAAAPKMVVEQEVVDAGQVVRGQTASVTFVVKNEGDAPLKIMNVKPG